LSVTTDNLKVATNKGEIVDTQEIAERMVRELSPTEGSQAGLFGILATGETFEIGRAFDVYDLLDQVVEPTPLKVVGLAVTTSGWASPLNENGEVDCPPSQHPERRRVVLVAVATAEELLSAMRFADADEVITETNGQGSLADALRDAFTRITA
jgi:hypothetical protein